MEKESAISDELEVVSRLIREAILSGRRAVRELGSGLIRLWEKDLWQLGEDKQKLFFGNAFDAFGLERRNVRAAMTIERTFSVLEAARLYLPVNVSLAAELARLNPEKQPVVWQRVIEECEKGEYAITVLKVRDAVNQELESEEKEGQGIEIDMGDDEELSLSEKGEEALARIKALCGTKIAEAIRLKRVKITEDSLRKWADQDDDLVKELAYYVVDKGWSVRKSLNYMSRVIDGDTQIDELILMARNRGGRMVGNYQDARITVEIVLKKTVVSR